MAFTDSHGNVVPLAKGAVVGWRVAAYAIIVHDGKLLMTQSGNGLWIFPGGGVEESETMADAIVRECLEETGYGVTVSDSQPYYVREQQFYHTREAKFYHSVQLFYTAELKNDSPDTGAMTKHDSQRTVEWISLKDVDIKDIHPTIHEVVKRLTN